MAFDNLMAMEQPWKFRSTFTDAWISDILPKETETLALTKALQKSFAGTTSSNGDDFPDDLLDSLLAQPEVKPVHTPTISGASENDFPVQRQRRGIPASGRVTKRKSRASKRATTTFITADPANFRQMVQQVTGVRLGGEMPMLSVLKPEPQRAVDRLQPLGGLSTFDTTSFFLDSNFLMNGSIQPSTAVADGGAAGSAADFGFDSFCSFPTLESWKV